MTDLPPFDDLDLFDEAGYLRAHPGVAEAIMQGLLPDPWTHYARHGRREGRRPNDVDPAFYLAAYPETEQDLGRPPTDADAAVHYIALGRARGYLPHARAPRPANAAALVSPFGGFWTDQANALDLIQGRFDLGRIRRRDVALLRSFALDGIADFDRPIERDQSQAASLMLDQAFTGAFPDLLFAQPNTGAEPEPWRPELTARHVAAMDPHMVSGAIRDLLLDSHVTDALSLIFDAPPRLTASHAYLRQDAAPDRDLTWFAHTLPLQFVAVTFALEENGSGSESEWPGSHLLPDLPLSGDHVTLAEAVRAQAPRLDAALAQRADAVLRLLRDREPRTIVPAAGSRRVRHANLIHAVRAPEQPLQQRTVTAWYCPSHVLPCYMESAHSGSARPRIHRRDGIAFSSGVYPDLEPRD